MKYIKYLFLAVIGAALVLLALANVEPVTLTVLPHNLAEWVNWNFDLRLPLFLVILGGILAGLLIGFVWEWFREHKQRAEAKAQRKDIQEKEKKSRHRVVKARQKIDEENRLGMVTIATNMAGRGTDIQLGGNADMRLDAWKAEQDAADFVVGRQDVGLKDYRWKGGIYDDVKIMMTSKGIYQVGADETDINLINNVDVHKWYSGTNGGTYNTRYLVNTAVDASDAEGVVTFHGIDKGKWTDAYSGSTGSDGLPTGDYRPPSLQGVWRPRPG